MVQVDVSTFGEVALFHRSALDDVVLRAKQPVFQTEAIAATCATSTQGRKAGVRVLFCVFFFFFGVFLVLGLQEGRKQGRKQQPGRIGRKDGSTEGGQEGRKEGSTEGGQEGRKEGRKEGGRAGRKEGRDRIVVHICAGNARSNCTFC